MNTPAHVCSKIVLKNVGTNVGTFAWKRTQLKRLASSSSITATSCRILMIIAASLIDRRKLSIERSDKRVKD